MTDPTKNTFENASALYLDLTKPTTNRLATTQQDFIIGYQGQEYAGGTSRGLEIKCQTANQVYIDWHAADGATGFDFDYRMICGSSAGNTAGGLGSLNFEGLASNFFTTLRTNPPGGALPPAWYIDYGQTDASAGVNQATTITFNTTFVSAPKLQLTLFDKNPGGGSQAAITLYTEAITTTGATVRGFGTMGADMALMWLAIGGV